MIMDDDVLRASQDYKNTVDKVNNSIRLLKTELISLRKSDITLLRQLIHISDIIQACYQRFAPSSADKYRTNKLGMRSCDTPALPLVRQQSVPSYLATMIREGRHSSICSSFEGIDELPGDDFLPSDEDDSIFFASDVHLTFDQGQTIRPRSLSYETSGNANDFADDMQLENILLKNVELWKDSDKERTSNTCFA